MTNRLLIVHTMYQESSSRDGEPVNKPRKVGYLFPYLNMFDKRIRRDYNCTNTGQINN